MADAIMDPANPPPWTALTAEERRDELPKGLWAAVQEYLDEHPGVGGYVEVGRRDGRSTFFVGIAVTRDRTRAALSAITGDRVVVERWEGPTSHTAAGTPQTAAELWPLYKRLAAESHALAKRLSADAVELAMAGWYVADTLASGDGGLEAHVVGGAGADAAAEYFAARYGAGVEVKWLGPNRFRERLRPFGSWQSDGRRLRVHFALDPNGEERGPIRLAEQNEERIVVALTSLEPEALIQTLIGGFIACHADVELREPVGSRVVIDASTGVARPCVTVLRTAE